MARRAFVVDEVIGMLRAINVPNRIIEQFQKQVKSVLDHQPTSAYDDVQVGSVYGAATNKGLVELTLNHERVQMEPKKASEIGLMLLQCAEAATSDEIFMQFLVTDIGLTMEQAGAALLDLRAIRQGTRGVQKVQ